MKNLLKNLLLATWLCTNVSLAIAQSTATVRLDAQGKHQHITGFGGFVCSPQFTYNHMSTTEIKKVWGESSSVGCNIMRLYIPIGKNSWSQSLATAKTAKQMGLIVFASPWGQPAEWKTNGTINAKNSDGTTGKLKRENWADYAQYLEDYVQYLRKNGVELDAISIQNEPDWPAEYAGCLWSASEIAEFVKTYGRTISCKIMAPETLSVNDSYVNALNNANVLDCFDIYGGHQYGGIQTAYKNLAKKGKEIWMTEYLINWNEAEGNTRNFDFSKDFFNFFRAINTCMLGDFNAWIHYAAKRYYAMMGDGQRGAGSSGVITKRGYVMAHFAKFITGMTRIDASFNGASLEGSAYLSQTGDTAVIVIANTGDEDVELTCDLPFYTTDYTVVSTTKTKNFSKSAINGIEETCRPVATIPAQSVSTVFAIRTRDRQPSDMTGIATRFDRIDEMTTTKTAFGTNYKLSGKTKTFDSSNPLISSRTNATYGYVALDERYSQLVMQIKKVTTTNSLTAGATTLTYVNNKRQVSKHEYGRIDLSRGSDFDLVFDLSPATLADGCIGLISLTCDNSVSHLTITFGDVYLSNGNSYAAKLTGAYVNDDSYVLEYTSDAACTSLDLTNCTSCPSQFPWLQGTNRVVWLPETSPVGGTNLILSDKCQSLELFTDGGNFRPERTFTADAASLTTTIEGARMLMLPFAANVPEGMKAYTITNDFRLQEQTTIAAHQPVLIIATDNNVSPQNVTFTGSGDVAFARSSLGDQYRGSYMKIPLYAGDYIFGQENGQSGWKRVTNTSTLAPFDVYAQIESTDAFISIDSSISGITETIANKAGVAQYYDLQGRRIISPSNLPQKQVVIKRKANGKAGKILIK